MNKIRIRDVADRCGWTPKELFIRLNKEPGINVKTINDEFPELEEKSQLWLDIQAAIKLDNDTFEEPIAAMPEGAITEAEMVETTLVKSQTIQQVLQAATEDTGRQHAQIAGAIGGTRNALAYIESTQAAYQKIIESHLDAQFAVTSDLLESAKKEHLNLLDNCQERLKNVYELRQKLEQKRKEMAQICNKITNTKLS